MYDALSSPFFNHQCKAFLSRELSKRKRYIYIAGCIEGTREMFLSNCWGLPLRTRSLVFRYRLSRPAAARRRRKRKVFLINPVKTKGNRCGYRLVRLRLQIRYRLPRDKILSSLFRLNQIGYKLFDRFISK